MEETAQVPGASPPEQPSFQGRRLSLRALTEADSAALFEAVDSSREGLKRRLGWVCGATSVQQESRFIASASEAALSGAGSVWGVFESRSGRLVGVVSLSGLEGLSRLSGWIRSDRRDKGYATEAGRLLLEHGFRRLGLHRFHARIDPANRAFRKVLKKLGFRYEGCLRDHARLNGRWIDQECWGILRSEWRK